MERRSGGSQEPLRPCRRLFRLIKNSLAFQSLKRVTQRRPGDQNVTARDSIEIECNGKFGNVSTIEASLASPVGPARNEARRTSSTKRDQTMEIVIKEANSHKTTSINKGSDGDRQSLNGKVHNSNLPSTQHAGETDKQVKIHVGAPPSNVSQGRDAKTTASMNGGTTKKDGQQSSTNVSIDAKAEKFIKDKLANLSSHSFNESRSDALHTKK